MTFSTKLLVSFAAHAVVAATLVAGGAHAQGFHTNGKTPDSCSAGTAWNYTAKRCEDEPTPGTTGLADAMEAYGKAQREHKPLPFTVPPINTTPMVTSCPVGPSTTTVTACEQAMRSAGWTQCCHGAWGPPAAPTGSFKYGSKTIYPYAMQPGWREIGHADVLGGTINNSFIDPQGHVFACIANINTSWTGGNYCVAIR
jgi:hypothetical protein